MLIYDRLRTICVLDDTSTCSRVVNILQKYRRYLEKEHHLAVEGD